MDEPRLINDLLDRAAWAAPDRLAVVSGDLRLTYREFQRRVLRAGAMLQGRGVARGHRVAILDKNSHYYLELYFALPRIGAVVVPLNYRFTPPELVYILNDSTATTLLFSREFAETVAQARPELTGVEEYICFEEEVDGAPAYGTLLERGPRAPAPVDPSPDDVILQMYTSGTTGRPKGAMLSHGNMIANTLTTNHERDYAASDTYMHVAPLYHCADLELFYGMTYAGGGNVIVREFDPDTVLGTVAKHGVTVTLLVPAMINFLLEHPRFDEYDLSSLRLVVYGGSSIPLDRLRTALERFPCRFTQGYGLTETSPVLCVLPAEDHDTEGSNVRRIQSCGRPAHNVAVKIVDEQGAECPPETVGEIIARGKNVMQGYWNMPQATAEAVRGGWFYTGDLAHTDADGYVYIVDRKKDMICSGAENIYPREIEEVLFTHPAVLEAAVIGVPSDTWGETVKAIVVTRDGLAPTSEELIGYCRERLAPYKAPRSVDFIEALPRNASGKILKRELREPYWAGHERRVN